MNYEFTSFTIDDIRKAISNKPEFAEYNRGHFIVFNYNVVGPDTFPPIKVAGGNESMRKDRERTNILLRECRGLIFSPEGKIISRRFHKFFNMNERDETQNHIIAEKMKTTKHIILEKLDGSMITPIPIGPHIRWGTKMGIGTDVATEAEIFIATKNNYKDFANFICTQLDCTPIFEFMSSKTRIVVDYPEPNLVLLAIRDNNTGQYLNYDELITLTTSWNIPLVQYYTEDIDQIAKQENMEGAIILFDDGHMVKLKCEWYLKIHKTKEYLHFEKDILRIILDQQVDDLMPHLPINDQNRIKEYQGSVLHAIVDAKHRTINYLASILDYKIDRKQFALEYAPKLNPFQKYIIFKSWDIWQDNPTLIQAYIISYMLDHCNSKTTINKLHNEISFDRWRTT